MNNHQSPEQEGKGLLPEYEPAYISSPSPVAGKEEVPPKCYYELISANGCIDAWPTELEIQAECDKSVSFNNDTGDSIVSIIARRTFLDATNWLKKKLSPSPVAGRTYTEEEMWDLFDKTCTYFDENLKKQAFKDYIDKLNSTK